MWIVVHEALSTQNKFRCYSVVIQTIQCHLCRGDREDVDHLFFYCPFSHRIWFDICSRCLIPFHRCSQVRTISQLSNLRDRFFNYVLMRLILASLVCYIWRERNARLHVDAPRTSLMVFRDIVSCIVSKVKCIRDMASLITNRRLHIMWVFYDDILNPI